MIQVQGVSKQYGSKILFEKAEAQIGYRSRLALVGPNGSGKSTLIRMILGQESADTGQISRANRLAIGHLAQEVPKLSNRAVLAEVMRLDGRREELLTAKNELEEGFAAPGAQSGPERPELLEHYGRVLEELEALDEYRLEAKAKKILTGMGFATRDFERSLAEFSGGWLMRVALSRVLLMEPDLLLLDEPTNHLDLESLLWLESFLRSYRGAMLLVSHDTEFLNRMVTQVLEIDQRRLWTYKGNLEAYAAQKQERLAVLRSQHASQQVRIAEIESFVARFGAKATKARQAQSRLKELEKIERIELPEDRSTVRFRFPPAPHSGKEVVTLKHASFGYGVGTPAEHTLFRDLDWVIRRGSRIAIVGVNGAGKTTLLKLLAGQVAPTSGELRFGHEVKLGYYAQHQAESLDPKLTVLRQLETTAPEMPVSRIRGVAGAFLFSGDAVDKRCGVLSGGEKARVALAKLLLSPANFLLLDEPTNHLDVESRGVLLDALRDFEGTLCLVSHDRAFISPLVDSVLEIVPSVGPSAGAGQGSRVIPLLGGYEDYLQRKMREIATSGAELSGTSSAGSGKAGLESKDEASGKAARPAGPSNNQRRAWERERGELEAEVSRMESRRAEIHRTLDDPAIYDDQPRLMPLLEEQKTLEPELHRKISRWEELCLLLGE